jgi:hypothetical protein
MKLERGAPTEFATKFEIASPRAEFLRDSATLVNSRTAELNPDSAVETDNV